jgi:two-component system sensor histidine kinase UhpB
VPLLWRVFASNAAVLAAATLVLVVTPLTVSFPIALTELIVLTAGLAAMLALNLALMRRALGPLRRLTAVMRDIDPLHPGERAALEDGDPEVAELTVAFNDMLSRLESERRDSARRSLLAQEGERQRVARELHDEVGQLLTAVVLQLDGLRRRVDGADTDELEQAREAVRSSLDGVRDIARRLRPEALDELGLGSALAALVVDISRHTGLRVERQVDAGLPRLSPEEELVVYRIAQEALTNAVRHGRARHARVTLGPRSGAVELAVHDDGEGFDIATTHDGAGLRGMRERAVLIGAELEVASSRATGTTVRLRLAPGGGEL